MTTTIYTIYDHPLDYPDHFVIRRWFVKQGVLDQPEPEREIFFKSQLLYDCVELLRQKGLVSLHRFAEDDPKILASYI